MNNDYISRQALIDWFAPYLHEDEPCISPETVIHDIRCFPAVDDVDNIVLPCKVGDAVYRIHDGNYYNGYKPFVCEMTVTEISWKFNRSGKDLSFALIADGNRYKFSSIGKSVFLSKKDAEKALRERMERE